MREAGGFRQLDPNDVIELTDENLERFSQPLESQALEDDKELPRIDTSRQKRLQI